MCLKFPNGDRLPFLYIRVIEGKLKSSGNMESLMQRLRIFLSAGRKDIFRFRAIKSKSYASVQHSPGKQFKLTNASVSLNFPIKKQKEF